VVRGIAYVTTWPARLPIRTRITAAFAAVMTLLLVGLGAVAYLSMGRAMLDEIDVHLDKLADDDTVAVVRVRSAGSSCFCAGADLDEFAAHTPSDIWRRWNRRGQEVFARLAGLPHPSIAVLHGHALGGGLELALHCDLRVAAITARLGAIDGLASLNDPASRAILEELGGAKGSPVRGPAIVALSAINLDPSPSA